MACLKANCAFLEVPLKDDVLSNGQGSGVSGWGSKDIGVSGKLDPFVTDLDSFYTLAPIREFE